MAMEWDGKVAPPTLRCCLDGRTLVAGERIVSALRLDDGRFVRDDCAACSSAAARSGKKNIGTGASRISEPLPALSGAALPANGSPLRSKRASARAVVAPMSKHAPVQLE